MKRLQLFVALIGQTNWRLETPNVNTYLIRDGRTSAWWQTSRVPSRLGK